MAIKKIVEYEDDLIHIFLNDFNDIRGNFVKTFNDDLKGIFEKFSFKLREEFFSISNKNVIRGMHFQYPPYEHTKIIMCLSGSVKDLVLNIKKSSDYGKYYEIDLDSNVPSLLLIGKGYAHGFLSKKDNTIMMYKVDSEYHKDFDKGIKWDSFDYSWNVNKPIISERDKSFINFKDFITPF
jgi:dTDP-4-dehydrorhamnose 3,5-epimerase